MGLMLLPAGTLPGIHVAINTVWCLITIWQGKESPFVDIAERRGSDSSKIHITVMAEAELLSFLCPQSVCHRSPLLKSLDVKARCDRLRQQGHVPGVLEASYGVRKLGFGLFIF